MNAQNVHLHKEGRIMNARMRTLLRTAANLGARGLCATSLALGLASTGYAQIVVTSSVPGSVNAGSDVVVTYAISGTGESNVATYTGEVTFDSANIGINASCLGGSNNGNACTKAADCPSGLCAINCTKDARLTDQVGQFSLKSAGDVILFVGDTSFPVATFGDGTMFTCTFKAIGVAGTYPLTTTFLEVANTDGDPIEGSTATDASIVVTGEAPPTATRTNTPTATPTHTATQTPTTQVVLPTSTSTATATPKVATATPGGGGACPTCEDDDGCQIGARGHSAAWLLLIPAVGLLVVRRRR